MIWDSWDHAVSFKVCIGDDQFEFPQNNKFNFIWQQNKAGTEID